MTILMIIFRVPNEGFLNILALSGVDIPEHTVKRVLVRQLPSQFEMDRTAHLSELASVSRERIEVVVRRSFVRQRVNKRHNSSSTPAPAPSAPAVQNNPHALALSGGGGFRSADNGGSQQRGGDGGGGWSSQQRQQQRGGDGGGGWSSQQRQQQRGGDGGWSRQQQQRQGRQQQQQYQSQQSRRPQQQGGGDGWPSQPQQQQRRRPRSPRQKQRRPRSSGEVRWGRGGLYDCGSNAVYDQVDSPAPAGMPMGYVWVCARCGRRGHKSEHCMAPRAFDGHCDICGQKGHTAHMCCLRDTSGGPQANSLTMWDGHPIAPASPQPAADGGDGGAADHGGGFYSDDDGGDESGDEPSAFHPPAPPSPPPRGRHVSFVDAPAVWSGSTADAAAVADDADWNEGVAAREQLRGLDRLVGAGSSFNLAALSLLPANGNVPVEGSEPVRLLGAGGQSRR